MKKNNFKIKNFFFASLFVLFLYGAYFVLTVVYADYVMPPARQSIVFLNDVLTKHFVKETPKTIILGDSTAAFGYAAGTLPGTLSIAIFSGSFAEIYYAYKRYLNVYEAPRCIVLSASYNWAYHRDGRFWDIYAVNDFYHWEDLDEIYETSAKVHDFPASDYSKAGFFLKFLIYKMRLQGIHLSDIQDGLFEQKLFKGNRKFYKLMRKNAGNINKTFATLPFIWEPHAHLNKPFQPAPLYDEYLKRLVELANSKGTQVHWIQLPISSKVYNDMAKKHYENLNQHLQPIIMSSPLNTYDGKVKIYPDEELFSATHLNRTGALRFTEVNKPIFENCNKN